MIDADDDFCASGERDPSGKCLVRRVFWLILAVTLLALLTCLCCVLCVCALGRRRDCADEGAREPLIPTAGRQYGLRSRTLTIIALLPLLVGLALGEPLSAVCCSRQFSAVGGCVEGLTPAACAEVGYDLFAAGVASCGTADTTPWNGIYDGCDAFCGNGVAEPWEECDEISAECTNCRNVTGGCCEYAKLSVTDEHLQFQRFKRSTLPWLDCPMDYVLTPADCPKTVHQSRSCQSGAPCCNF